AEESIRSLISSAQPGSSHPFWNVVFAEFDVLGEGPHRSPRWSVASQLPSTTIHQRKANGERCIVSLTAQFPSRPGWCRQARPRPRSSPSPPEHCSALDLPADG